MAVRPRSRSPTSRPTTPLRASSRSSFRTSQNKSFTGPFPLDVFEPQFAELSDSMADLEANLMHLQLLHESLSRFGESFASFLYGLNMNAFVVDFPEVSSSLCTEAACLMCYDRRRSLNRTNSSRNVRDKGTRMSRPSSRMLTVEKADPWMAR